MRADTLVVPCSQLSYHRVTCSTINLHCHELCHCSLTSSWCSLMPFPQPPRVTQRLASPQVNYSCTLYRGTQAGWGNQDGLLQVITGIWMRAVGYFYVGLSLVTYKGLTHTQKRRLYERRTESDRLFKRTDYLMNLRLYLHPMKL